MKWKQFIPERSMWFWSNVTWLNVGHITIGVYKIEGKIVNMKKWTISLPPSFFSNCLWNSFRKPIYYNCIDGNGTTFICSSLISGSLFFDRIHSQMEFTTWLLKKYELKSSIQQLNRRDLQSLRHNVIRIQRYLRRNCNNICVLLLISWNNWKFARALVGDRNALQSLSSNKHVLPCLFSYSLMQLPETPHLFLFYYY